MLDLEARKVQRTANLHLRDEFGDLMYDDGQPVSVDLYGPGTEESVAAQSANETRMLERMASGNVSAKETPEAKLKRNAESLADVTARFNNLAYKGLEGRALALAIYAEPTLGFITDQVRKFQGNWANFSSRSTKA